jgi:hypothetical protein
MRLFVALLVVTFALTYAVGTWVDSLLSFGGIR